MFTGLVKATGKVQSVKRKKGRAELEVNLEGLARDLALGDSVAVNGCCLTLTALEGSIGSFDMVPETLSKTNLLQLEEGSTVNLEPALRAGDALGGHFVQGHIDCVGEVLSVESEGDSLRVRVRFPAEFSRFVVTKGSIALDGVSLTVADTSDNQLEVALVPHTIKTTTLGTWEAGYRPNVEFDILAKYVDRLLDPLLERKQPR